ncbi:hypothetical protein PACTADRAFT_32445 [Pachysolen tannophilus NRRL Y-2460]|uniref:Uncharacterized protein n=1 Tax=Pachysolen tannophilus NRRL Y-2460 TaxID=669874 RepID=A0A1E4TYX6_PACTA|nr:hypothetical protein PACTADRAFT_32445 [Pachysolen tannophilus NRRL Y-2460]
MRNPNYNNVENFSQQENDYKFLGSNEVDINGNQTDYDEPLFELESKLNPVFIEHGELNVKCNLDTRFNMGCKFIGIIRKPKYYIDIVTFNNSFIDIMPYQSKSLNYKPNVFNNQDTFSRLASYFFIFENLPGEIYRHSTLDSISQTDDFKKIRSRIEAYYREGLQWRIWTDYILLLIASYCTLVHLTMLITKQSVIFFQQRNNLNLVIEIENQNFNNNNNNNINKKTKNAKKFLKRLQTFSKFHIILVLLSYLIHRFVSLLNYIIQTFILNVLTENITFNSTKYGLENFRVLSMIISVGFYLFFLLLLHHITFKNSLVEFLTPQSFQENFKKNNLENNGNYKDVEEAIAYDIRNSMADHAADPEYW